MRGLEVGRDVLVEERRDDGQRALDGDEGNRCLLSVALNVIAVGVAFVKPGASQLLYLAGASLWFVPDRRVEREA